MEHFSQGKRIINFKYAGFSARDPAGAEWLHRSGILDVTGYGALQSGQTHHKFKYAGSSARDPAGTESMNYIFVMYL